MATDELLLRGGFVHVFDDDRTVAEAVLFRDGRVASIGDAATVSAEADDAEIVELDGRPVVPGFNDAHAQSCATRCIELTQDVEKT